MKHHLNFPGPDPEELPPEIRALVNAAERMTEEAAMRVAKRVDDEITKAIQMRIGIDWKPNQLVGRLHRTIYFDGSEVMVLDGVPILHISPWKWAPYGLKLTPEATRECTHLKGADDVLPN